MAVFDVFLTPTATQNVVDGHDTPFKLYGVELDTKLAIFITVQSEPFQAWVVGPTAMHHEAVAQETSRNAS